jgi:hypothetical protein
MVSTIVAPTTVASVISAGYDKWFCPCGTSPSDCVAAYEFINRPDAAIAKLNLNDPSEHALIDGTTAPEGWSSTKGFWNDVTVFGYLASDIVPDPSGLWSWFLEWAGNINVGQMVFGSRNGSIFGFYNRRPTGFMRFCNFVNEETYPAAFGTYVGVSDRKCYVDGVHVRTMGAPVSAILPVIWVMAGNGASLPIDRGEVHRLVIWNKPITDAQMLDVTNYAIANPPI